MNESQMQRLESITDRLMSIQDELDNLSTELPREERLVDAYDFLDKCTDELFKRKEQD